MADALKVLGQTKPGAGVLTDHYPAPAGAGVAMATIVCCNQSPTAVDQIRISIAVAGAADDPKQYLYFDLPVAPNDTFVATIGMTLAATDKVRVRSANGTTSFNGFGAET